MHVQHAHAHVHAQEHEHEHAHAQAHAHQHPHEQIMHVQNGEFEFTIEGESKIYRSGDIVYIPSNCSHSGKALTPCSLMDVFSPAREEYK